MFLNGFWNFGKCGDSFFFVNAGCKIMVKDERKYKRDFLRTVILLKEIKFFSDHLFKEQYKLNDAVAMLQKHIDNQIYLKYDFIVQKMVKTLHFQCSDFQFLKMFG